MGKEKWKEFEKAVYEIQKQFSPNAKLIYDYKVKGKRSGTTRQVDIALFDSIGQYNIFIAIECKDYKRPVDIKPVESFAQMLEDIGSDKGVIVSSNGFSNAAIKIAQDRRIDVLRLVDADKEESNLDLKIPVSYELKSLSKYVVYVRNNEGEGFHTKKIDIRRLAIFDNSNHLIGFVPQILEKHWNSINRNINSGVYSYQIDDVQINTDGVFRKCDLRITYTVDSMYFTFELGIAELKGFLNEASGKLQTNGMITEPFRIITRKDSNYQVSKEDFDSFNGGILITYFEGFKGSII